MFAHFLKTKIAENTELLSWQDDPEAHEKFVRINRAYEVLKDEDLRKVYDLHGEKGLDGGRWASCPRYCTTFSLGIVMIFCGTY